MRKTAVVVVLILAAVFLFGCTKTQSEVTKIYVKDGSIKYTFDIDEDFCYGDGILVVGYADGVREVVITSDMIDNFDTVTTGKRTLNISYGGKTTTFDYEVVYSKYPSKKIKTDARLTINQTEYPTGIGRSVSVRTGSLQNINAIYFTVKGNAKLCDSLSTVDVQSEWEIKKYFVNASCVKIIAYSKEGISGSGEVATINFAGVKNAEIVLSEITVSDGKEDWYLPDTGGV